VDDTFVGVAVASFATPVLRQGRPGSPTGMMRKSALVYGRVGLAEGAVSGRHFFLWGLLKKMPTSAGLPAVERQTKTQEDILDHLSYLW
jgi:hypothetical protein